MSSAFNPAIEELINVVASPDAKSPEEISIASSKIIPSTTHNGLELP